MKPTYLSPVQYSFIHIQRGSIHTKCDRHDGILIKAVIKMRSGLKGVNEILLIKNVNLGIYYVI
jgi:hypothetical protein